MPASTSVTQRPVNSRATHSPHWRTGYWQVERVIRSFLGNSAGCEQGLHKLAIGGYFVQ